MSDFDKEAERERLREKYEKDQAEREATQRMSDLLLKGARMTNTHCNTCGDPLFQMNGTTFCPSCHGGPGAVEGTELEGGESGGAGEGSATADASGGATQADASDGAAQSNVGGATDAERGTAGRDAVDAQGESAATDASTRGAGADAAVGGRGSDTTSRAGGTPSSSDDATAPSARAGGADAGDSAAPSRAPKESPTSSRAPGAATRDGDLESARGSLKRALERFAREAAETNDPRYARECLEAAREAADALAALRRGS